MCCSDGLNENPCLLSKSLRSRGSFETIPAPPDYVVTYRKAEPQCQRPEEEAFGSRAGAVDGDAAGARVGGMHAAPCASVSELYSADEVALLLDEIRELEPTSCRGEDVQDFEIAGSGLGGAGGGVGGGGAGGRSPCGTELTERSWDSHAHYSRAPPRAPPRLAPLYCRLRHLVSPAGACSLLLALAGLGACACVWALCGVRTARLPLAGRVRLLLLGGAWSALAHGTLVFAHVSRLAALLPLEWRALRLAAAGASAAALGPGAALTLHAVLAAPDYRYAPPHVARLLLAAAGLGVSGALLALVMVCLGARGCWRRHRGCLRPPAGPGGGARGAYRAVPSAPPPAPAAASAPASAAPQPSTSRDHPL